MKRSLFLLTASIVLLMFKTPLIAQESQSSSASSRGAELYQIYLLADDRFDLKINGNIVWSDSNFSTMLTHKVYLRANDVLVISVTDDQGGYGGRFAAVLTKANQKVLSTRDFRYCVDPGYNFHLIPSQEECKKLNQYFTHEAPFGLGDALQPKVCWAQESDFKYPVVHFKAVVPAGE